MQFERIVRTSPVWLMVIAAIELIYRAINFRVFWQAWDQAYYTVMGDEGRRNYVAGLVDCIYSLIIYPVGWVVSAITLHVLIAIYDKGHVAMPKAGQ